MMPSPPHDVVLITSEIFPFSKSGGLADVLGALPVALRQLGVRVAVVTPLYGRLSTGKYPVRLVYENCPVGFPWPEVTFDVYAADYHGVAVYFIERPEYFDRRGYYCTPKGDYFDNGERFIFFCRAALSLIHNMGFGARIVHAHDWHAALAMAYIYFARFSDPFWWNVKTVFTIHNLAYQGRFSYRLFAMSGLPAEAWHMDGVEFYSSFNYMKAGIAYADRITTVSPSYAEEILTPEFGCGMEGLLQRRRDLVSGVLNGMDQDVWNPARDPFLPCCYDATDVRGKMQCKMHMLERVGLSAYFLDRPVLGFVGRLRGQKGIDMVLDALPMLMALDVGLVVLGEGNPAYEARLFQAVEDYPGQVAAVVGYTEEMAHVIQAGTDIFLMPSRYEPCGLTQMYSLRYGTIPVATAVGGLRDTIVPYPLEDATGFMFAPATADRLVETVREAVRVWRDREAWREMQRRAMESDFSWERSARQYVALYRQLHPDLECAEVAGNVQPEGGRYGY
jgi:starch synthase